MLMHVEALAVMLLWLTIYDHTNYAVYIAEVRNLENTAPAGSTLIGHIYCFKRLTVQKSIIHQLTTMLSTSENVLFPGHNHLVTTGANDHSL